MFRSQDNSPQTGGTLKRHRSLLLAGIFAVAVTGFAAGQVFVPYTSNSAIAQITTDRPAHQYSFADVVDRVRPAVVSVKVKVDQPQMMSLDGDGLNRGDVPPQVEEFFKRFFGERGMPNNRQGQGPRGNRRTSGQGSGFFISQDGYVVTNNHVIEKSSEVEITTDDGKTYPAKVVGSDPRTDVALLKVDGRSDFQWVKFAPTPPRVGDWVLAVGNPFGLGGTVTAGIVSARGRDIGANVYDDFIQIDAPVNRGNSGGPTFNLAGEVIGVNTAIISPSGGSVGIAFAIPAENVNRIVGSLKETGTVTRGFIGVNIQPINKEIAESLGLKDEAGALVSEVSPDAPAAKAGVKAGDAIIAVDGERLKDARDLSRRIASKQPGTSVKLLVSRDKKEQTIDVTLARLPDQQRASVTPPRNESRPSSTTDLQLGLSLAPAKSVAGAGGEGVVITNVDPNGPGADRGLRSGDVILEVAGKVVTSPAEVREAIDSARKDSKNVVLVRVKREKNSRFVTLPVERDKS